MTGVILGAPWWRCLHCGCGEYVEHVFTGHMKGTPMIRCAKCDILHSPPNPDSKSALRWRIAELEGRIDAAVRVIQEGYPGQPAKTEQCVHGRYGYEDCIACYDDALLTALAAGTGTAETSETSARAEGCQSGPKGNAPNQSGGQNND